MKSFLNYLEENDKNSGIIISKLPVDLQAKLADSSVELFKTLVQKYPTECFDFIQSFADREDAVKNVMNDLMSDADDFIENPVESGLGYVKGYGGQRGLVNYSTSKSGLS